jgi:DNA helicase HerA-like ATPase
MGKKWLSEVALTPDIIGQDIKTKKISYQVKIKLLGRFDKDLKEYTPGIKNVPHITSKVIQPDTEIIETILHQALGESSKGITIGQYWGDKNIDIKFNMEELIGKRTFIFARAGYGKSNLMKVLASYWEDKYGSLLIFDPEGEYSVTDKNERPGIMDKTPAILITNRKSVREELKYNVYDNLRFDLRQFFPSFIVPILVVQEKHETIFFQKLMGLNRNQWINLVDYLSKYQWRSNHSEITNIMDMDDESSAPYIMNNLILPIQKLHDPESHLLDIIEESVENNYKIIIDISLLDSHSALQLSSTIISYFFNKNQRKFTGGKENLNKITFAIEEAQSVIGGKTNVAKFVELAKEGRKYELGGIFITQQPGSISWDILSQGDNFFVFHLISQGDLKSLRDANAHFSNDILTEILNEPIKGKSYMWTSNQPFVVPIKVINFEDIAEPHHSKEIQFNNNLLDNIIFKIENFDEIQKKLFIKLKAIIKNNNLTLDQRDKIYLKEIKKELSKELYNELSTNEKVYIDKQDGIAKYEGEPFAVKYYYFENLYENAVIFFRNQDE